MKLNPTSSKKFVVSKTDMPNRLEKFPAIITSKTAKVREWAGAENKETSLSPLKRGAKISVCDAILSKSGNVWYYVKCGKKYGFVSVIHIASTSTKAMKFIECLERYHVYVRDNNRWFMYKFMYEIDSFTKAKNRVADRKKVGITCLVPIAWALHALGIKRKDGISRVSGEFGSFKSHYTGDVAVYLERITSGGAIGLTIKSAVDNGLLKPGDIIAFKGKTHTFAYSGDGYVMYEGGHSAMKNGKYTGIRVFYENRDERISEILRWKE